MSRWLQSVNTLLDSLDDKVETAVEEHEAQTNAYSSTDDNDDALLGRNAVDDILAKRGYVEEASRENEATTKVIASEAVQQEKSTSFAVTAAEDSNVEEETEASAEDAEPLQAPVSQTPVSMSTESTLDGPDANDDSKEPATEPLQEAPPPASYTSNEEELMEDVMLEGDDVKDDLKEVLPDESAAEKQASGPRPETIVPAKEPIETKPPAPAAVPKVAVSAPPSARTQVPPPPPPHSFSLEHTDYKKALAEAREAQKECRTLRRHVVSLNSELESAEAEIQAQRTELERAAERMEKDRTRQKEEKERLATRHATEVKALKTQHEQTVANLKKRAEQQAEESRVRMKELEQRRMQEGGNWTKEMENALHREQESVRRMANLEDEKSTLLSQISTLQAQQAALEDRLDSVSQTADNAMEREREAEDRLDAALSMHARQLTQRQARESELERTIADLGAALVVARNKEITRIKSDATDPTAGERGGNDVSALRTRLEDSEDQKETILAQLELERQRCITMQQDLQELSKERTEEAAASHARQLQNDRKIADMSVTISRLQASARDSKKSVFSENRDSVYSPDDGDRSSQVRSLSDQVLKQQESIARSKSEISALKNRLQVAVGRAEKAEETLASRDSDDVYDRMEAAPLSGSSNVGLRNIRRRGGGRSSGDTMSIRSAIRLNPGQSEKSEKIGKAIDAVDSFSVQTGKYLRSNPLARAGFLLYLLLIHLWTFVLLFFHAHGFETVHGDFGAGQQVPHGPHALMQAHDPVVAANP